MMNVTLKSLLIAAPLSIALQAILVTYGQTIWGDQLDMAAINIVGAATGFVCFMVVKKHFLSKG